MKYLPSVTKAKYLKDFVIELSFDDGTKKAVDFSVWLRGEVFEPLKNKSFFKKFFLDGATVAWPNGADIAPEALYKAREFKIRNSKYTKAAMLRRRKSA